MSVYTAKPGIVIGKGGAGVEALKKELEQFTGRQVALDIMEIKNPDCDATLVAENIAQQLEKRISFRRAMKQSIARSMKAGAKGIKTTVSGRLGGADIARSAADPARQHRLWLLRGQDDLRPHRRQGVDLQGPGAAPERQEGSAGLYRYQESLRRSR